MVADHQQVVQEQQLVHLQGGLVEKHFSVVFQRETPSNIGASYFNRHKLVISSVQSCLYCTVYTGCTLYNVQLLQLNAGCTVKLSALRFCYFLGFQSTYRRTSGHFSIAQEMRISKLTLLSFLREKLI